MGRPRWLFEPLPFFFADGRPELAAKDYDAVILPGGHGRDLACLLKDHRLHRLLEGFLGSGKLVGLQCHSVVAAAFLQSRRHVSIAQGRTMICWPGVFERVLSVLPLVGSYFLPLGDLVQKILEDAGASIAFQGIWRRNPQVVADGNLITSLGPESAECLSTVFALRLQSRLPSQLKKEAGPQHEPAQDIGSHAAGAVESRLE